jgi:ribonuclease P protein component
MLPINRRVKKELFPEIMKNGRFLHGESFYLKVLDRKDNKLSLFSFVVPAKIVKTSVKRHLIKRKMTAVVEKILPNIKPGFSSVIFLKKPVTDYHQIEKEILELVAHLGYTL